jgi:hypothetical protein
LIQVHISTRQLFPKKPGPCPVRPPGGGTEAVRLARSRERFTTGSRDGLEAPTLVTHPLGERILDERELCSDFLHRPPVSMTRCASSVLNSSVNRLLVAPTVESFQPTRGSACQGSTFAGDPQQSGSQLRPFLVAATERLTRSNSPLDKKRHIAHWYRSI